MRFDPKTDAPLLVVMGQSNAHGHGTKLPQEEQITTPLSGVFGLARTENQAYGLTDVTWSGFCTGGMNLGETQDHTYCLAESFARKWQAAQDSGEELPPLYVVQISIGAQGIARVEKNGCNMWYPEREKCMRIGSLEGVDISLYPLATEILSLTVKNLLSAGKQPRVIGVHWNQWETEVDTGGDSIRDAESNYRRFFEGFREAMGMDFPLWLYYPRSLVYQNPEGLAFMQELFTRFAKADERIRMMDPGQAPFFDASRPDQGIFMEDLVHYLPRTHRWFAEEQFRCMEGGNLSNGRMEAR